MEIENTKIYGMHKKQSKTEVHSDKYLHQEMKNLKCPNFTLKELE